MTAQLEHANLTVTDPDATAGWMCRLFGWTVRWSGPALAGGRTVHVGTEAGYLALYRPATDLQDSDIESYARIGGLNHVGVIVPDLALAETRVRDLGFTPHSHADYAPGKRFYFHDFDGIEFELVEYPAP